METLQWLLQTDSGVVGLIFRITVAVVIFPHGAQKVLGWFGGHGFKGTMKYFAGSGIPAVFALLAIAAEFLGPVGLAVGLLTRVAAFGIACVMFVAIVTVHWPNGFFMNWYGNQKGEGFEYHLLVPLTMHKKPSYLPSCRRALFSRLQTESFELHATLTG